MGRNVAVKSNEIKKMQESLLKERLEASNRERMVNGTIKMKRKNISKIVYHRISPNFTVKKVLFPSDVANDVKYI